ncbi:sensor histidine kinase [Sphingorhabdus sp.]|uniref:sensor histidine kinase n=1 Tax=Sphingorhabdus sp. TaxID=1902408 RepID=UPI0037CCB575
MSSPKPPTWRSQFQSTGSLTRRMILTAAAWITILLIGGGAALDRVLTNSVEQNFDTQIEYVLTAMIASAEIGPDGEIRMNRPLGDQRFLEPNSGLYWQITGKDAMPFPSRSLWDRALSPPAGHKDQAVHFRNSDEFPDEPLRIAERSIKLPDSDVAWTFMVAQSRNSLDAQIQELRSVLVTSFFLLALGLIILAALQTLYGLWPLRAVRKAIAQMRSGQESRVTDALPDEVMPMVNELNALLDYNEKQAEESRRHAGNLAHALKTPLTVIMNSATAQAPDISETVIREATTMRRQVDHHLARARAVGRRGHSHSRAVVWGSLEAVERAVGRLYAHVRLDMAGDKAIAARVERQDLDEMLGNLIENAAKYGGGSVFVTVEDAGDFVEMIIEDDGQGIPESERERLFDRGARLDTGKPGTGLGLAIVRDVVEIYGGTVALEKSEDLGGLLVRLRLPKAIS